MQGKDIMKDNFLRTEKAVLKINPHFVMLPCSFSVTNSKYSLKIFGSYIKEPPSLEKPVNIESFNLDGEYVLIYENLINNLWIIFRSHIDSFGVYYAIHGNEIYISDSLFILIEREKKLTWNRQSLSDYFEAGWNNIQKKDRTPFREINKLPVNFYMEYSNEKIKVKKWNKVNKKKYYTMHNLDEFRNDLFSLIEYYLKEYLTEKTGFTVSGGIDSTSLACYANKLFPANNFTFYSTKFDDAGDESSITISLSDVLKKEIHFITPKLPSSFIESLRKIQIIVESPYSDIEGITHIAFFEELSMDIWGG